jgi:hypothetical protein
MPRDPAAIDAGGQPVFQRWIESPTDKIAGVSNKPRVPFL